MNGYDSTPSPRFLQGLQNQHWPNGVVGSLAELVDNSFDSARGNAKNVSIIYAPKERALTVIDDGEGMDTVGPMFKLGAGVPPSPGNIGVYGNGGKLALLWLGRAVRMITLRKGRVNQDGVVWPEVFRASQFPMISTVWEKASLDTCPKPLLARKHGVMIQIKLNRTRRFDASKARRDLAVKFAPGLRKGLGITWTTTGRNGGTYDLAELVEVPAEPLEEIPIDFILEANGEHLPVKGRVGLYPDLSWTKSRISIGYGHRELRKERECYRSPDGEESYVGTGVAGWVDLIDWPAGYLSQTKEDIDDKPVKDALMAELFRIIRPLLKQVDEEEMLIEFDELALQLEQALNSEGHRVDVSVAAEPDEDGGLMISGRRGKGPGPGHPVDPAREDESGTRRAKKPEERKERAQIKIWRMSDDGIGHVLCTDLDKEPGRLDMAVNKDHPFVQAALNPPNRLAFNALITREIARRLAGDEKLLRAMLPDREWRKLPEHNGEGMREQLLHRYLVEKARDVVES